MNKQEIMDILSGEGNNQKLFQKADSVRREYVGNQVHLRGLIEFSNICKRQCLYCGLRAPNRVIERYRLSENDILLLVERAVSLGYRTVVLQSGEDDYYDTDRMCQIIKDIKKFDVALTLSIGERTYEEYKAFKQAGADRYLMRIETTDRSLYEKMHPFASYENRINCLYHLKKLGYETGTGCLVGLPDQTRESLADDILFFKELDADMVGIGPFIPHAQTPLKDRPKGDFWLALKVMAITRLVLKNINIPATTAMETLYPNGRDIALQSGANVVMPNITSTEHRMKYEIYPGKAQTCLDDGRKKIEEDIISLGRTIATDYGFRVK